MRNSLVFIVVLFSTNAWAGVVIPERDADGVHLSTQKITKAGWQYQLRSFQVTTCQLLEGYLEREADGSDPGFFTMKWFDNTDTELIQGGAESDVDFQARLDTDCEKTQLDWTPTFDYQLLGGQLRQAAAPSSSIILWVIGVPDYTPAQGGTKIFIYNLDLKFMPSTSVVEANGRTPKELLYNDPIPGTNKLRYQFVADSLGMQHTIQISMELFKP